MAEEKTVAEEKVKSKKRGRHWDDEETKILISKWSEDNIQEKLKSCTRKKKIWQEILLYLQASGYEDRDEEMCKTRIHTLTSAYRNYLDNKRNTSGTGPSKKPSCFDEIDKVLSDKPTTLPTFLKSSSGTNVLVEETARLNSLNNCVNELKNCEHIDIEVVPSSSKSEELFKKDKSFYFKKSKKKKSRSDVMFEQINATVNTFMTSQADIDRKILDCLLENHKEQELNVILKVRQAGDIYLIEIEFLLTDLTLEKLTSTIKEEFTIENNATLLITKLPNVLIRNDKDVKRLKSGAEIEFLIVMKKN
ncbi:zinc finger and SCAN domain-containing protein 29 [Hydra vulgaris]|uniref:zinc finger and SCAN domain-containing protein 29 n=1 Tax=Hydra vulgaris TaxID=6087 RepID=UPI001F5E62F8|nr:zinc finger and SCAN domain-containing protein 29-like [Hydra vulgaris]